MSLYLLTYDCPNMNHVKVFRFPEGTDTDMVRNYRDCIPGEIGALIAQTPLDLKIMGPTIVKLYNDLVKQNNKKREDEGNPNLGSEIKKFENLAKGQDRLFRAMIDVAVAPPEITKETVTEAPTVADDDFEEDPPRDDPASPEASEPTATEGDADMAKKKAKKKTNGKRASRFQDTDKIRLIAKKNPRREGTRAYNMFEKYTSGMTVAEFVKKGGSTKDLRWDIEAGNISVG